VVSSVCLVDAIAPLIASSSAPSPESVPTSLVTGSASLPPIRRWRTNSAFMSVQRFASTGPSRLRSSPSLSKFCSAAVVSVCDSPR
jgi:hypothetical protein